MNVNAVQEKEPFQDENSVEKDANHENPSKFDTDESSESTYYKNNDNRLLFASTCTNSFFQSKYILNAD